MNHESFKDRYLFPVPYISYVEMAKHIIYEMLLTFIKWGPIVLLNFGMIIWGCGQCCVIRVMFSPSWIFYEGDALLAFHWGPAACLWNSPGPMWRPHEAGCPADLYWAEENRLLSLCHLDFWAVVCYCSIFLLSNMAQYVTDKWRAQRVSHMHKQ